MQRVDVMVQTRALVPGEGVQVYGPDASGDVDLSAGLHGGRLMAVSARREWEGKPLAVRSGELASGLHEFAVRAFDGETGAPAADPTETVKVYINTSPRPAASVRAVEELVGGRLRFTFGKLEE